MAKLAAVILIWACTSTLGDPIKGLRWHSSTNLQGTLDYHDFYGPPNYGETPEQDRVERAWLLTLEKPIQVSGEIFDSSISTIAEDSTIHLLGLEKKWHTPGVCILVEGEIFPSISGHHRKPILLDVTAAQPCSTDEP